MPKKGEEYILAIGEALFLGPPLPIKESLANKFGIDTSTEDDTIVYAGMPTDRCYSLAQRHHEQYSRYGYNLFFPINQREIEIAGHRFAVTDITPQNIKLRYLS
jgi:hypothetical protein